MANKKHRDTARHHLESDLRNLCGENDCDIFFAIMDWMPVPVKNIDFRSIARPTRPKINKTLDCILHIKHFKRLFIAV